MKVTKIITNMLSPKDRGVCGEFTITLDDCLCIHKVCVVNGERGFFITFPNTGHTKRFENAKKYVDLVHPTNSAVRQYIQSEVLKHYEEELKKGEVGR